MSRLGANLEQLQALGTALQRAGERVTTIESTLARSVQQPDMWMGPDADQFRGEWTQISQKLRSGAEALGVTRQKVEANLAQQREASGS